MNTTEIIKGLLRIVKLAQDDQEMKEKREKDEMKQEEYTCMNSGYILPRIKSYFDAAPSINFIIDEFSVNTVNSIASGSGGEIYKANFIDDRKNPVTYNDGTKAQYVMKKVHALSYEDLDNAALELHVQYLIYKAGIPTLKTPYIFPMLFRDNNKTIVTFMSEYVKPMNALEIVKAGFEYNDLKSVMKDLATTLNNMDQGKGDIIFKHNDLHVGNFIVTLTGTDGNKLRGLMIDYGTAVITSYKKKKVNKKLLSYQNKSKEHYMMVTTFVRPQDLNTIIGEELLSTTDKFIMSDWHLFYFSTFQHINEVYSALLYEKNNLLSVPATYRSQMEIDALISLEKSIVLYETKWINDALKDFMNRYGFLNLLQVEIDGNNNKILKYNQNEIKPTNDYPHIHERIIDLLTFKNNTNKPVCEYVLDSWKIVEWRYLSMFIEIYIKGINDSPYKNSIKP